MTITADQKKPTDAALAEPAANRGPGLVRLLLRDPVATIAVVLLVLVVAAALLADIFVQSGILLDPLHQDLLARNKPPMFDNVQGLHLLGTDQLGRDLLARLVFGARISLGISAVATLISGGVGVALGLIAGYRGGLVDDAIMRFADIQLGFPQMLVALAVIFVAGPTLANLVLVLALTRWMTIARVTRAATLSLRQAPFIEAARSLGASHLRVVVLHIFPSLVSTLLIIVSLEFGRMMLTESALSFLGLGIQPPDASWGLMLAQGRDYMGTAWWLVTFPGLAITVTTLSVNLVAGWVRTVADPNYRKR